MRGGLRELGLAALLLGPGSARAAGYYLFEADARGGVTESGAAEGGIGVSLYSEELDSWVTMGDTSTDGGRRVKEWWLASHRNGPVMGVLPPTMAAAGFEEPERSGEEQLWIPFRSWRFGSDYSAGRWLCWDASSHLLLNLGSALRVSHRSLLFGPSVGVGAELTWWEGWRGNRDQLINTGKITAEAGWIAGVALGDFAYGQARLLAHVDAFGDHQHDLAFTGLVGLTGAERGLPLGLELSWELHRGNDTVDTLPGRSSVVMLGVSYRLMPSSGDDDAEDILEALRQAAAAREVGQQSSAPLEPEPTDSGPEDPETSAPDPEEEPPEEPEDESAEPAPSTDAAPDTEPGGAAPSPPPRGPVGPQP